MFNKIVVEVLDEIKDLFEVIYKGVCIFDGLFFMLFFEVKVYLEKVFLKFMVVINKLFVGVVIFLK